ARYSVSGRGDCMDAVRAPSAILHPSGKLATGRIDIFAARLSDRCGEACILQNLLESGDAGTRARPELGRRERVERDQVELARNIGDSLDERARLMGRVVDTVQHHVFEGDKVARRTLDVAHASGEELSQRIFA